MFQTVRRRLAIWYATVTAIVLLVFASGVYIYVRSTLVERIDDTLNHVVEVVSRSLAIEPTRDAKHPYRIDVTASFRDNSTANEDDRIDLELFDSDGTLIWSTMASPLEIPLRVDLAGTNVKISSDRPGVTNSFDPDRWLRQLTYPIDVAGYNVGYLRLSHPWFEVTKPTQQLILDLGTGSLFLAGTVAGIGWFLSGLAIEPALESYQKLKQFTADASHELRNPVATIQTNVQVALSNNNTSAVERQEWQIVERLTRRLGKLVDDLLFLAREDSVNPRKPGVIVPLDALLMEVVEEQQLLAKNKNITIQLEISDSDGEDAYNTIGDWDRLARLFTNLVANAWQYTPTENAENLPVTVSLQTIVKNDRPHMQVTIQDRGIGIPAADLPKLYDRFYRVDRARSPGDSGSGLGLAIARTIVTDYRGYLSIESIEGSGTKAIVVLPH
jgi:OmpR-family two-component system manganese-sensing sensor histidine kinase